MARWKGLGAAAVAALAFVAVKVLPWGLGFAGGKYLYQTVAGSTARKAPTRAEVEKQDFQIFKAIAQEFPDDYNAFIDKITLAAGSGNQQAVRDASRVAVAELRRKYAPLLPSAPDREISQALAAQLTMVNHLMARETPVTCNNYLRYGPDAISAPGNDFLVDLDRIGATLFHAFGAAKRSSLPAAEPSDEDWSLIADAFTRNGGTPAEMDAIANMNQDFSGLCPAVVKFYTAALSMPGEPGRHIKTALLYATSRN
ncbi:MAG: hypothetical protein E5X72_23540 [Mesorhizobium sp.]|uniref:hypothetical protein n=1 Tax=Mesorhizobium sp. TaxID=1871066 RepID=UPI00120A60BE|nr:hypothetical protein [Mesorhizobium sp.]TIP01894.1 MAG: hypothetical protein E5X72_23540 [Mesorhizobium sp.]